MGRVWKRQCSIIWELNVKTSPIKFEILVRHFENNYEPNFDEEYPLDGLARKGDKAIKCLK